MTETIESKEMEHLFHYTIESFKRRWENKGSPISPVGIYNYAMSVMKYEFFGKFEKEKSKELEEQYNPNK